MIKNKMALLGAAATLGVMGGAFVSPAQAITLNGFDSWFSAGGVTVGDKTFTLDSFSANWANADININEIGVGSGIYQVAVNPINASTPDTYTFRYSVTVNDPNFTIVSANLNSNVTNATTTTNVTSGGFGGTALGSSPLVSTGVLATTGLFGGQSTVFFENSTVLDSAPGSVINSVSNTVTQVPVPWETDALSVIGVTTLFGFGVWNKRKRKVDLSK
ncbi:MAG: hypothetical protein ACKO4S_19050 [Snowella sp.]